MPLLFSLLLALFVEIGRSFPSFKLTLSPHNIDAKLKYPVPGSDLIWDFNRLHPNTFSKLTFSFLEVPLEEQTIPRCDPYCKTEGHDGTYKDIFEKNSFEFHELHNTLINGFGTPIIDNVLYLHMTRCCTNYYYRGTKMQENIYDFTLPFVLGGLSPSHQVFGHLLCDWLLYLQMLPKRLIQSVDYLFDKNATYAPNVLSLLDVDPSHIHFIPGRSVMKVGKFLALTPNQCLVGNKYLYTKIKKIIYKKTNITDQQKPFRHVFFNRCGNQTRIVMNDLDVLEVLQESFKETLFTLVYDLKGTLEGFKFYHEVQTVFSVHSSVFTNFFMMQPGSMIIDYQTMNRYYSFEYMARSLDIRYAFTADRNTTQNVLKLDVNTTTLGTLLEYIKDINYA